MNTVAWLYIFLPCAIGGGLFFTVRTRGVQLLHPGHVASETLGGIFSRKRAGKGSVSAFQALSTALSASVGTGNIVGTCQAITMGGPGAVLWLWAAGVLGMATKYCEVCLSIRFRERDSKGDWVGGPMYYLSRGLPKVGKPLAAAYAVMVMLASFGIGSSVQVRVIGDALSGVAARMGGESIAPFVGPACGILCALLVGVILFGGIRRIGSVTERLVPLMSGVYIIFCLVVICTHLPGLGTAFRSIFAEAFTGRAAMGAASGIALRQVILWGMRRSAFSNEAGLGSAAIAHAAADTDGPVQQGMFGILEVFVDTLVICTLTALTVLSSGVRIPFGTLPDTGLITGALATSFGENVSVAVVALCITLFGFSTSVGWSLYGTRCAGYLLGERGVQAYRWLFLGVIALSGMLPAGAVWDAADTFNALLSVPNFIALFALSGTVAKLTADYFKQRKNVK